MYTHTPAHICIYEKEATAAHADTDLISFKDSPRTWFITQKEKHCIWQNDLYLGSKNFLIQKQQCGFALFANLREQQGHTA